MIDRNRFGDYTDLVHLASLPRTDIYTGLYRGRDCMLRISNQPNPPENSRRVFYREKELYDQFSPKLDIIPPIFDQDIHKGHFYTAYNFSGNTNLIKWREKHSDSIERLLNLCGVIISNVSNLHSMGRYLGHLKPEQIFVSSDDRIALLGLDDIFDLSENIPGEASNLNQSSFLTISPEMTGFMDRFIDNRSDIYSIGTLLYFILSGDFPFSQPNSADRIHHLLTAPAPLLPLSEEIKPIGGMIQKILAKTLEIEPDNRYQNSAILHRDWNQLMNLWEKDAEAITFPIAKGDRWPPLDEHFSFLGREKELALLKQAQKRIDRGDFAIVEVKAPAGMGKTRLVERYSQESKEGDKLFIKAKLQQFTSSSHKPLISRLMTSVAKATIHISPAVSTRFQELLLSPMKDKTDLINELSAIPIQLLPSIPAEEKTDTLCKEKDLNIIHGAVIDFLSILAQLFGGLMLFVDDIQWLSKNDILFIQNLLKVSPSNIMFIYSIRSEEAHNLEGYLDTLVQPNTNPGIIQRTGIPLQRFLYRLEIAPFDLNLVMSMVDQISPMDSHRNRKLAQSIMLRTSGNPLFIREYIQKINRKKIIFFNSDLDIWDLNVSQLNRLRIFDSVILMLKETLAGFPEDIRNILAELAHLDSQFSKKTAHISLDHSKEQINAAINYCIAQGILISDIILFEDNDVIPHEDVQYRFIHDNLYEAAYAQLNEDSARRLHSEIANKLLNGDLSGTDNNIHIIARHISLSNAQLLSITRQKMIKILCRSSKLHFSSHNIDTALEQARFVIGEFTDDLAKELPKESREIFEIAIECCYRLGLKKEGEQYSQRLVKQLKDNVDRAYILGLQMEYSFPLGEVSEALSYGYRGLKLLNYRLPKRGGMLPVLSLFMQLKVRTRFMGDKKILNLPINKDRKGREAIKLYSSFIPAAFNSGRFVMFSVAVLKSALLSLDYGLSPESAAGFVGYAILLSAMGNKKEAYRFGKLAVEVNAKFNDHKWKSMVYMLHLLFCVPWVDDWYQMDSWIDNVIGASKVNGETLYQSNARLAQKLWTPHITLGDLIGQIENNRKILQSQGFFPTIAASKAYQLSFSALAGEDINALWSDECLQDIDRLIEGNQMSAAGLFKLNQLRVILFFNMEDQYERALDNLDKHVVALSGSCYEEELKLFTLIILSRIIQLKTGAPRGKYLRKLKGLVKTFKKWAEMNPLFEQHYYLGLAFRTYFTNLNGIQCAKYFDMAIKKADQYNFLRYRALFRELTGDYYCQIRMKQNAMSYYRAAIETYQIYGARGVVDKIYKKHPPLVHSKDAEQGRLQADISEIDMESLLNMSQSLSKEMDLKALVHSILDLILRSSGAQRGVLILVRHKELEVALAGNSNNWLWMDHKPVDEYSAVNREIVYSVYNSSEAIISNGDQGKSILCYPFISKQEVKALVYLENAQTSGVFAQSRLNLLKLLSSGIVISIENARLYGKLKDSHLALEERVNERTRELDGANRLLKEKLITIERLSEELKNQAVKDELTSLYNRRYLNEYLPNALATATRQGVEVAAMMVDLDHFKRINDNFGHSVGDLILQIFAETLLDNTRKSDTVCRFGGEEFVIILPHSTYEEAEGLAEKLRMKIEQLSFDKISSELSITISIGVSLSNGGDENYLSLLNRADEALYRAKNHGRNRVETFITVEE